jgi:hypothetical protein
MAIKISDLCRDHCNNLGIDIVEVYDTAQNHDKINVFDLNQIEEELTKQSPTGGNRVVYLKMRKFKQYSIITQSSIIEGTNEEVIELAYKLNQRIVSNLDNLSPEEILQQLMDKVGVTMIVDGDPRTFVTREQAMREKNGNTNIQEGRFPQGDSIMPVNYLKLKEDSVIIALKYSVNLSKYKTLMYTSGL